MEWSPEDIAALVAAAEASAAHAEFCVYWLQYIAWVIVCFIGMTLWRDLNHGSRFHLGERGHHA